MILSLSSLTIQFDKNKTLQPFSGERDSYPLFSSPFSFLSHSVNDLTLSLSLYLFVILVKWGVWFCHLGVWKLVDFCLIWLDGVKIHLGFSDSLWSVCFQRKLVEKFGFLRWVLCAYEVLLHGLCLCCEVDSGYLFTVDHARISKKLDFFFVFFLLLLLVMGKVLCFLSHVHKGDFII